MPIRGVARDALGACRQSGNFAGLAVDKDSDRLETNVDGNRRQIDARRLIAAGATETLEKKDSGAIVCLDTAAGSVVTLPAATGSGAKFTFVVTVTATSNSHVIQVGNATDEFRGYLIADASEATAPNIWWAADNDDTITFNRTTTGTAAQGHRVEVEDLVSGHWYVSGVIEQSGIEATPFSAAVS